MKKFKLLITSPFVAMAATAPIALASCGGGGFTVKTKNYPITKVTLSEYYVKDIEFTLAENKWIKYSTEQELQEYKTSVEILDCQCTDAGAKLATDKAPESNPGKVTSKMSGQSYISGVNTSLTFTFNGVPTATNFNITCNLKVKIAKGTETVVETKVDGFKFTYQA